MSRSFAPRFGSIALGAALTMSLALGLSGVAKAQTSGYTFTPPPAGTGFGGNYVFGNAFTVNTSIIVNQLGYAAPTASGGETVGVNGTGLFGETHDVAIYNNTTGTLVTPVLTLTNANTTVISGFRYANLSSAVTLVAGQSYTVAGTSGTVDPYAAFNAPQTSTDARINNLGGRIANSATIVQPQTAFAAGTAGPNFRISATASSAPEPGALALLASGGVPVLGLALRRRRALKAA